MEIGDVVEVVQCNKCPKIIGKTGTIKAVTDCFVDLNFGRGRPTTDRPETYRKSDVKLVH